jgi:YD repeat-containing protein
MMRKSFGIVVLALLLSDVAHGQMATTDFGVRPGVAYSASDIGLINVSNGNLVLHIPLWNIPQRGDLSFPINLVYNSPRFGTSEYCDFSSGVCYYFLMDSGSFGVHLDVGGAPDFDNEVLQSGCTYGQCQWSALVDFVIDPSGASHALGAVTSTDERALDGSGFLFRSGSNGGLIDSSGIIYGGEANGNSTITDRNGNQIVGTRTFRPEDTYKFDENGPYDSWPTGPAYVGSTYSEITDSMGRQFTFIDPTPDPSGVLHSQWGTAADTSNCQGPLPTAYARQLTFPGPQNQQATFKLCYAYVSIKTNCTDCGVTAGDSYQFSKTLPLLQSVILPNNQYWTFEYAWHNPGDPQDVNYGLLSQITAPTGAVYTYTYTLTEGAALVTSRTVDPQNGETPSEWDYDYENLALYGPNYVDTIIETLPANSYDTTRNQIVHTFPDKTCGQDDLRYEAQTSYYQGSSQSGKLLKQVQTTYECEDNPLAAYVWKATGVVPSTVTTILDDGSSSKVEKDYTHFLYSASGVSGQYTSTYGTVSALREYDYGQSTPTRTTTTSYYALSNPDYLTANLIDLPSTVTVQGVGPTRTTSYFYDEGGDGALLPSGAPELVPSFYERGNVTTRIDCASCGIETKYQYYDSGLVASVTDPNQHVTSYTYDPLGEFQSTVKYPDTTSGGSIIHHIEATVYDDNTGLLLSSTDQNGKQTTAQYDEIGRLKEIDYPDEGQTRWSYNDTAPTPSVTETQLIVNPSLLKTTVTVQDGLERTIQMQLMDPDGPDYTDLTYDGMGRIQTKSNPHRLTSLSTDGITTTHYDALGRTCLVVPPDAGTPPAACPTSDIVGDNVTIYQGSCATAFDDAGKSRKSCSDALGRLTGVWEDPGGLNYETDYSYDAQSNLIKVVQNGDGSAPRVRTFSYDSLSRLLCAANPEIQLVTCPYPDNGTYTPGTIRYSYDLNGNVISKTAPAPNQTGSATVITTYSYDALNRLTQKSYSDGTPTANFYYDNPPSPWAGGEQNTTGRLVEATTGHNSEP